jgi:hypothetical protein
LEPLKLNNKITESFEVLIVEVIKQLAEPKYDIRKRALVTLSRQVINDLECNLISLYGQMDFDNSEDFYRIIISDKKCELKKLIGDENKIYLKDIIRQLRYCFKDIDTLQINSQLERIALNKEINNEEVDLISGL